MPDFHSLLIVMVVVWTTGSVFRHFRLPMVFGELLGGIIVGPLMLGIVDAESEVLKILAELGIFFLMLHAGLKTDPDELLEASKKSLIISIAGLILPFLGGYAVARLFGQTVEASLFIALGLSISAIALASRLFKDCKILDTPIAHTTMSAAIINDIAALVMFSVIMNYAESGTVSFAQLGQLSLTIVAFFAVIIIGGLKLSPFLNRIIYLGNKGFTLTLIIALFLGIVAEHIGLHMIIGAFLAGLFIREEIIDDVTFNKIEDRIYGLSYSFFGPIFFATLAFHLDFTAFTQEPLFLLSVLAVAILGKLIGCGGMAWLLKFHRTESITIGFAMNNRGAVELIIATIGLEAGIIDQTVFSILVITAVVTTLFSMVTTMPMAPKLRELYAVSQR